jgi:hypothetical protein
MDKILDHATLGIWIGIFLVMILTLQTACSRRGAPFFGVLTHSLSPLFEFSVIYFCFGYLVLASIPGTEKLALSARWCLAVIIGIGVALVPELKLNEGNAYFKWLCDAFQIILCLPEISKRLRAYLEDVIEKDKRATILGILPEDSEKAVNGIHHLFELFRGNIAREKIRTGAEPASPMTLMATPDAFLKYELLLMHLGRFNYRKALARVLSGRATMFPSWPISEGEQRSIADRRQRHVPVVQDRRSPRPGRRLYDSLGAVAPL